MRRCPLKDGVKVVNKYMKMFSIFHHRGDANKNCIEISLYLSE